MPNFAAGWMCQTPFSHLQFVNSRQKYFSLQTPSPHTMIDRHLSWFKRNVCLPDEGLSKKKVDPFPVIEQDILKLEQC